MQTTKPPAAAFYQVESILNPGYFTTPHPDRGWVLTIRGRDRVPTKWWVSNGEYALLKARLKFRLGVRIAHAVRYHET